MPVPKIRLGDWGGRGKNGSGAGLPVAVEREFDDESGLVQRAQGGSLEAFGELIGRYERALFNFLRMRSGGGDADVEDLTQETFLRAWRYIDNYDPRWRFGTWLFTIGIRVAITEFRRGERNAAAVAGLAELSGRVSAESGSGLTDGGNGRLSESEGEGGESIWEIARRVLSEDERTILWLRYGEDLSAAEIGRIVGKKTVGVRVILHRARVRLRSAMVVGDDGVGIGAEVRREE